MRLWRHRLKLKTNKEGWMFLDRRVVCEKDGTINRMNGKYHVWWHDGVMWFDQPGLGLRIW